MKKFRKSTFIGSFSFGIQVGAMIGQVITEMAEAILTVEFQCVQDDDGELTAMDCVNQVVREKLDNSSEWAYGMSPTSANILMSLYHQLVTDTRLPWLLSLKLQTIRGNSVTLLRENVGNEGEPHHTDKNGGMGRKRS